MIAILIAYLPLLLLTIAIECALIARLAPLGSRRRALAVCVALNLLTHPTSTLLQWRQGTDVLTLEIAVFCAEWLGYAQLLGVRTVTALRYSLLLNLCSALAGIAIWIARTA